MSNLKIILNPKGRNGLQYCHRLFTKVRSYKNREMNWLCFHFYWGYLT